jgi:hypothetical protein
MAHTGQQSGSSSRRALRDLVPVTLASGLAGLIVTLLVGGTTAAIRSTLGPGSGSGALPALAVDAFAGDGPGAAASRDAAVSVRVRPSRPAPIGIVSILDLMDVAEHASPTAVLASSGDRTALRSVALRPLVPPVPTVAAAAAVAPLVAAPGGVATTPAAGADPPARGAKASKAKAEKSASPNRDAVVSASSDRVRFGGEADDADDGAATPHHSAPPDHAVAKGHRSR